MWCDHRVCLSIKYCAKSQKENVAQSSRNYKYKSNKSKWHVSKKKIKQVNDNFTSLLWTHWHTLIWPESPDFIFLCKRRLKLTKHGISLSFFTFLYEKDVSNNRFKNPLFLYMYLYSTLMYIIFNYIFLFTKVIIFL